ncbi:phosphotransferase-like protein [Mesorhizobium waimense]|uniref:phosphotransferase-like protein n=1 Tax=Mesorhizobium waimense TaxID=1300307 RepID=UPI001FE161B5|nr:chloramphenicol phosphotransferase [Mesorhizobium waimense]
MTAKIVLLNGVGSAGKSSIAKDANDHSRTLPACADGCVPGDAARGAAEPYERLRLRTLLQDGKPSVVIKAGPVGRRTMQGMRHAVAAMAGQGNNLIVDDVLCDDEMSEYLSLLSGFELYLVGVFAPLECAGRIQQEFRL